MPKRRRQVAKTKDGTLHAFWNFLDVEAYMETHLELDFVDHEDSHLYKEMTLTPQMFEHPLGLTGRSYSVLKAISEKGGEWTVTGSRAFGAVSFLEENGMVKKNGTFAIESRKIKWHRYKITDAGKCLLLSQEEK